MSGCATIAKNNIYYKARLESNNEQVSNRIKASEVLSINNQRLYFIEAGKTEPYSEEILRMSEVYADDNLITHFCNNVCAIGKKFGCKVINKDTSNVYKSSIIFIESLKEAERAKDKILEILSDGEITDDEIIVVNECIEELSNVMNDILNLKLSLAKAAERSK